ncbi:hypothetical protein Krad_2642 [Kineococcus radiotolerans SRS30216 = ATCC BAA-149]|uniref:Uncharacterized protein n=1 Tax=Kineococcus radiotolerans (strain ATCC BAA-149 / DSM 14245 / SRS30216) TaxID=266940 RepID=A6WBC5_KINRD|nr:hypothetical protein Krad_2642 [Kineococcus radiotolerans SRS30216 = ATCC BAA-149]
MTVIARPRSGRAGQDGGVRDTWQEGMKHWNPQRWGQWFGEHKRRRLAERERSRRGAAERRLRIEPRWTPSGDPERDAQQRSELWHQDRPERPRSVRYEWEEQQALRRQEVLTYPTLPVRHPADLRRPEGAPDHQDPLTVGSGPAGEALALWGKTSERATHLSHDDRDGQLSASTPWETSRAGWCAPSTSVEASPGCSAPSRARCGSARARSPCVKNTSASTARSTSAPI